MASSFGGRLPSNASDHRKQAVATHGAGLEVEGYLIQDT